MTDKVIGCVADGLPSRDKTIRCEMTCPSSTSTTWPPVGQAAGDCELDYDSDDDCYSSAMNDDNADEIRFRFVR